MLRPLLALALLLACLLPARPAEAQDRSRDLLQRYGARLEAVDEKYGMFRSLCDLATSEQLEALEGLRISPSQFASLVRAVQENLPQGSLDQKALDELKRRVTPRFEEILGSEQFDVLLELFPSPQQMERARAILARAAATPEGRAAWEAAGELRASLTPEQATWLGPVLDLAKPSEEAATPAEPAAPAARSAERPERRLVFLRRNSVGDFYADVSPRWDYTAHLPRSYRVEGGDPAVLAAVSNQDGLPVRLLATVQGDVMHVARASFSAPAVLPVSGHLQVWRGRLPARVVTASPPTVELDAGRGQRITAAVELPDPAQQRQFEAAAAGGESLLGGTLLAGSDGATLVDVDFGSWQPPQTSYASGLLLQVSEEFLQHAAREYLEGHPETFRFGDPAAGVGLRVGDVGATLRGCEPGQVRLYGTASLVHTGLEVLEGQFEVVTRAEAAGGRLALRPVPGSLQMRVTHPLTAAMPASWIATLERTLGTEYAQGASVPVPEQLRTALLEYGLLEPAQIDGLTLFTLPGADRRTSLLALAAPSPPEAPAVDVLRSRIEAPAEFALALSDQALTAAFQRKVPGLLPIKREIPRDLQEQGGVRLTDLEIPELDLAFADGLLQIRHCVVNVYWSWGLFSGVEPGIRMKATARIAGSGDPMKLKANLQVKELEFLSGRILELPAEEQQQMKDKLIQTLQERELELSVPAELAATVLSPRARWVLTAVRGNQAPSELLIQGGLEP